VQQLLDRQLTLNHWMRRRMESRLAHQRPVLLASPNGSNSKKYEGDYDDDDKKDEAANRQRDFNRTASHDAIHAVSFLGTAVAFVHEPHRFSNTLISCRL
jgi:hypothetical protein